MTTDRPLRREPRFIWLFLGKALLLATTIVVVYALYAYLHAYRLDWLGWFYVKLLPLTNALYALVENYLPAEVRYKIRAAITDDLGQRSFFLLLLTASVELTLHSCFFISSPSSRWSSFLRSSSADGEHPNRLRRRGPKLRTVSSKRPAKSRWRSIGKSPPQSAF